MHTTRQQPRHHAATPSCWLQVFRVSVASVSLLVLCHENYYVQFIIIHVNLFLRISEGTSAEVHVALMGFVNFSSQSVSVWHHLAVSVLHDAF